MGKNWYRIGFVFALIVTSFSLLHSNQSPTQAAAVVALGDDCPAPIGVLGDDDDDVNDDPANDDDCDTISPSVVSLSRAGTEGSTVGVCGPEIVTITLSEPSEDFAAADVTASFGVLSDWIAVSPTVYTAVFTPPANSTGSATISIAAGTFTDDAANLNTAFTSDAIQFDTQAPTVAITRSGAGILGVGQTATITFTLSKPSLNFASGDVSVSAGTLTGWSATSSTVYTATFTPPVNSTGISTLSIAAGSFTDSCNPSKQNVNTGEQFDFIAIAHNTEVVVAPPPAPEVAPTTVTTIPAPPIALPTRGVAPSKKQVSARVYFGLRSAVLTPEAKRTLKAAVQKLPKNQKFEVVVTGMVQFSNNTSNIEPLAAARAEAVRAYLLTLGIKGAYEVSTRGIVGDTAAARRAIATVVYS
jgi:outer membrane protein OmpA-like peptidoglycan-associated protein